MATVSVATAAGAAALLYYTLNKKPQSIVTQEHDGESQSHTVGIARVSNRLIQAPATWLETISTLSETLRFTYSETLGKWPIGDLAFGISYLLKSQGNFIVGDIFGSRDSLQLKGSQITAELRYLLKLLTLCWHFSKKPFSLFLQETGFSNENVLLQEPKAGILKPAFTILADHKTNCFLLLIRGTHSIKDTLTAATGAVVPFHHTVVHDGGVSNLVLGYAHCGMAAAARWIAKLATPCLIKGLHEHPGYTIKIVGHSLGGGTAALLTYILHEQKDLSATTCVAFAPAACMTWELAESGNDFVTSVINGADLVPTFSTASVDGLRAEVTASAWLNDLRNQVEQTRILSTVYRSASALGSHLPSIANARAKVAGAGAILRPVSNGTQVVMRSAQSMAQAAWTLPNLYLSSWSCMGPHRRVTTSHSNYKDEYQTQDPSCKSYSSKPPLTPPLKTTTTIETIEFPLPTHAEIEWSSEIECSCSSEPGRNGDMNNETVDDEDLLNNSSHEDRMTEVDMWQQLDNKLCNLREDEEAGVTKELREEEAAAIAGVAKSWHRTSVTEMKEVHRFFPPGKIMHIVSPNSEEPELGSDNATSNVTEDSQQAESKIGIFLTPRSLYSKVRLSRTMIGDHFMPVYRRQIEKVIIELEKEPFR